MNGYGRISRNLLDLRLITRIENIEKEREMVSPQKKERVGGTERERDHHKFE